MNTSGESSELREKSGHAWSQGYRLAPDVWIPLLIAEVALLLANLLIGTVTFGFAHYSGPPSVFELLGVGLLVAQISLLDVALVFGSGPFWRRLAVLTIVGVCALSGWYWGAPAPNTSSHRYGDEPSIVASTTASTVFLLLVGLAPLWFARLVCGWRFVAERKSAIANERQFSLADLSAATVAISGAIGVMRAGGLMDPGARRADDHWLGLLFMAVAGSCFALFFVMPLLVIFFSRNSLAITWLAAFGYTVIAVIVVQLFFLDPGGPDSILVALACTSGIGVACTLMRCCGVSWYSADEQAVHYSGET